MSAQDRYTKIIESLVNGEEAKASELMHEAFVEKAREIWSDLVEQDDIVEDEVANAEEVEEQISDDEATDFIDDIESDKEEIEAEEAFGEDKDEGEEAEAEMELATDDADKQDDDMDFDGDGETDGHEEEHKDLEDKLVKENFRKIYTNEVDLYDLDKWEEYEKSNPRIFAGMYQFWCKKN